MTAALVALVTAGAWLSVSAVLALLVGAVVAERDRRG